MFRKVYMFRALLSHPQEAIHKRHLVYCVRVMSVPLQSWCSQLTTLMKSGSRWFHCTDILRCRVKSSISIVSKLLARRLGHRITAKGVDFSPIKNVQTGSGANAASYYFLGVKQPGRDVDNLPLCYARIENEWSYLPSSFKVASEKSTESRGLIDSTSAAYSEAHVFEFRLVYRAHCPRGVVFLLSPSRQLQFVYHYIVLSSYVK
jgi:hypothetical protein